MTLPVVVVRPQPGCSETVRNASARGLNAVAAPLFAIEPVAWQAPDPSGFDGLLVGSVNAFRYGGLELARLGGLPVHAVGERTAAAAHAAGFEVAGSGAGGLQALLDTIEPPRRLLRLAGEARADLIPAPGIEVTEVVVYRARRLPLGERVAERLREGALVLLHSGEAARALAEECARLGIGRDTVLLATLAPRIAAAAGEGWGAVGIAADVSDAALLAMAEDMCQGHP